MLIYFISIVDKVIESLYNGGVTGVAISLMALFCITMSKEISVLPQWTMRAAITLLAISISSLVMASLLPSQEHLLAIHSHNPDVQDYAFNLKYYKEDNDN